MEKEVSPQILDTLYKADLLLHDIAAGILPPVEITRRVWQP